MTSDADINTRSMWEHYLPVFHSCLIEAKAMHSMCSCEFGIARLLRSVAHALLLFWTICCVAKCDIYI